MEYLCYKQIDSLPIDFNSLYDVFEGYEWIIMTYEEAKIYLRIDDPLNIRAKKALARTFIPRGTNIFLTVYREDKRYPKRNYYTVAHELGHIVLGHFFDFEKTALERGGLTEYQYKVLEREAEIFAAELIMPIPILQEMKIKSCNNIMKICQVTKKAAEIRVNEIKSYQVNTYIVNICLEIRNRFYNFIYRKKCPICENSFVSKDTRYCLICGHKKFLWEDGLMKYTDGIPVDENGRAYKCPVCENEENTEGDHCKICGSYIVNKCTNDSDNYDGCGAVASGNARFCVYCGAETTFFKSNFLRPWNDVYNEMKAEESALELEAEAAIAKNMLNTVFIPEEFVPDEPDEKEEEIPF